VRLVLPHQGVLLETFQLAKLSALQAPVVRLSGRRENLNQQSGVLDCIPSVIGKGRRALRGPIFILATYTGGCMEAIEMVDPREDESVAGLDITPGA